MQSAQAISRIALAMRSKRRTAGLSVREAAQQCGVSATTISRLERGVAINLPDAPTLEKVAVWAGIPLAEFFAMGKAPKGPTRQNTTPEIVEIHLRADKNLSPKTAKALSDMFRALYDQFSSKKPDSE